MEVVNRKKILLVFGTRPEAIKMAPLVKLFQKESHYFDTRVCVTAQHREMLDQVLDLFEITPEYDLDLMRDGQNLYDLTATLLLGMKPILEDFYPDLVLVHGDTTTTAVASLAAFYMQIKVGHVEAGLRTGDIYSPWPEEANRSITGVLAAYHFTPTEATKNNLLAENKDAKNIIVTGNTVIDALHMTLKKIESESALQERVQKEIGYKITNSRKIVLVTCHRRENHGEKLREICKALQYIAEKNPSIDILYPVHLNPNVEKPVRELLSGIDNIYLLKPLEYEAFIYLSAQSYFILTDSGGIQEEAPSLGKPVLVMREVTEREEALDSGTIKLVGTEKRSIAQASQKLLDDPLYYKKIAAIKNPYGSGDASQKIVDFIKETFETETL